MSSVGFAAYAAAPPAGTWRNSYYDLVKANKANKVSTGSGVTVAVIDSCVQASLSDLAGRVLPGTSFVLTRSRRRRAPNGFGPPA